MPSEIEQSHDEVSDRVATRSRSVRRSAFSMMMMEFQGSAFSSTFARWWMRPDQKIVNKIKSVTQWGEAFVPHCILDKYSSFDLSSRIRWRRFLPPTVLGFVKKWTFFLEFFSQRPLHKRPITKSPMGEYFKKSWNGQNTFDEVIRSPTPDMTQPTRRLMIFFFSHAGTISHHDRFVSTFMIHCDVLLYF